MITDLIERYKRIRTYKNLHHSYEKEYAFIGVGNHSLHNLYPVLDFLKVPVKYIITRSSKTCDVINETGWGKATCDLEKVLNDDRIGGVFISTTPASHFPLIAECLKKGKNVFVEKPPCSSLKELSELIEVQKKSTGKVLVGMQKRYAPACRILRKELKKTGHYNLRYCTGAFPEGNSIMELYIHPLDILCYLFGKVSEFSFLKNNGTFLLNLKHSNGYIGTVELSTSYSWSTAFEHLTVVDEKKILRINGLSELSKERKPPVIHSVPLEKFKKQIPVTEILFNQSSFTPSGENNSLYVNGFYSEIKSFISMCETKSGSHNISDLESLRETYTLMEKITEKKSNV